MYSQAIREGVRFEVREIPISGWPVNEMITFRICSVITLDDKGVVQIKPESILANAFIGHKKNDQVEYRSMTGNAVRYVVLKVYED